MSTQSSETEAPTVAEGGSLSRFVFALEFEGPETFSVFILSRPSVFEELVSQDVTIFRF